MNLMTLMILIIGSYSRMQSCKISFAKSDDFDDFDDFDAFDESGAFDDFDDWVLFSNAKL